MTAAPPPASGRVAASARDRPAIGWGALILGFSAMVLGQFMAILDIQIVASSIGEIQAGIGATPEEVSWIQTSYLIAEVVMIPLSGYLARWWGTRPLFLASAAGFTVMSVAVGFSSSIEEMILFRGLQGFLGGAMIPLAFSVAFTQFPGKHRITAGTIMGLVVSLAPTIGPTLGGWISDTLGWRWLFFINVPVAIPMLLLVWRYVDFDRGDPALARGIDWWGLLLMAVGLMSLQFVLEEGSRAGWLEDGWIVALSTASAIGLCLFVWRSLTYRQPIVELRTFADPSFALGATLTFVAGTALFGGTFLLPLFMGQVLGYSAVQIGSTMVVSGLAMLATGPIAARTARVLPPRLQVGIGFFAAAVGFGLGRDISPDWGFWDFAWLQALRSFGTFFAMMATQNISLATLSPALMKNASGLINLSRNLGGAVALAGVATLISERTVFHLNTLSSAVSFTDTRARETLAALATRLQAHGSPDPAAGARMLFERLLEREAAALAFGEAFLLAAALMAAAGALALIFGPSRPPFLDDAVKAEAH